jgi:glycosyltransferase involved in cell wall biosynthesis
VLSPYYHGTGHSPLRKALHVPYRLAGAWLVRQARRLIYISDTERALLQQHFNMGRPYRIAPCGVEVEQLQATRPGKQLPGRKIVLAVGRLEPYKQTERLIMALPHLPPEYEVVVIGNGPLRPQIERLAAELRQPQRVRLLDHVPQAELLDWYRSADVFVSLSRRESFGLALLEGAAAGAGVVASAIPAHREVAGYLPDERVIFVHPDCEPTELGRAVEQAAGRGRANEAANWTLPTWEGMVDIVAGCYRDVLKPVEGYHAAA